MKGKKWKRILLKTLSFFGGLLVSPIIAGRRLYSANVNVVSFVHERLKVHHALR